MPFFTCTIAHFVSVYRLQGGYFYSFSITYVNFHNSAFTMHPVLTLTPTTFVQIHSPNSNPNEEETQKEEEEEKQKEEDERRRKRRKRRRKKRTRGGGRGERK